MRTSEEIEEQARQARVELTAAEGEVAQAILDGRDAKPLARQRDRLAAKATDWAKAAELAAVREDEQRRRDAEEQRRRLMRLAEASKAKVIGAAKAVDDAILALEAAYAELDLARIDFERRARECGCDDGSRLRRNLDGHGARWALYQSAPTFAEACQAPRTPANRRRTITEVVTTSMPEIK